MIFKAKDAGVNRKRKPLTTLYYCQVCMAKTNNQQGYKLKRLYNTKIVRNMKLLLKK